MRLLIRKELSVITALLFLLALVLGFWSVARIKDIVSRNQITRAVLCLQPTIDSQSGSQILIISQSCHSELTATLEYLTGIESDSINEPTNTSDALLCLSSTEVLDNESILLDVNCVDIIEDALLDHLSVPENFEESQDILSLSVANAAAIDAVITVAVKWLLASLIAFLLAGVTLLIGSMMARKKDNKSLESLIGTSHLNDWVGRLLHATSTAPSVELSVVVELLLDTLKRTHDLEPVGSVDQQVTYDPANHNALGGLADGHLARIMYPGWKRRNKVIRKPTVRPE